MTHEHRAFTVAREILGDDFISPEEIAAARTGVFYNPQQLLELGSTVPSREVLEWCRDNGFMVVAGPARPMSLLDIRKLDCSHFYSRNNWYLAEGEMFARSDKAICQWLILRKELAPGSTNKTWIEQERMLSTLEVVPNVVVPNVAEQVWGMTTYKAVRGVCLLSGICVRTSSVSSRNLVVRAGDFNEEGLTIDSWGGDARFAHL